MRFRQGGFVTHPEDYIEPKRELVNRTYY